MGYDQWKHRREIVTRAVCGKGRRYSQQANHVALLHEPTGILGAWMMNHQMTSQRTEDGVQVKGSYVMSVWYAYDHNTKTEVHEQIAYYVVDVALEDVDASFRPGSEQIVVHASQPPSCIDVQQQGGDHVVVRVEWELAVELVAETTLCVWVSSSADDGEDAKTKDSWYGDTAPGVDLQLFESIPRYTSARA